MANAPVIPGGQKPVSAYRKIISFAVATILLVGIGYINEASVFNWWPFPSQPQASQSQPNYASLKQSGKTISATITNIVTDNTIRENYQSPYLIQAQWTDPASGTTYTFYSGELSQDPSFALRDATHVTIYVDPNNYTHYYMDLSSVGL